MMRGQNKKNEVMVKENWYSTNTLQNELLWPWFLQDGSSCVTRIVQTQLNVFINKIQPLFCCNNEI